MKFCTAVLQQFKCFSDKSQLPIQYLNSVQNVHQQQQHMIEICCKITQLPHQ